jgi:hypothetical protein
MVGNLEIVPKHPGRSLVAIAIALFALALDPRSAAANSMTITDGSGAMWEVDWKGTSAFSLTISPIAGAKPDKPNYLFNKTAIWEPGTKPSDFDITFTQKTGANTDKFGLRFTLNELVTNNTGKPWGGYNEQLIEVNGVSAADVAAFPNGNNHPWFAHWHSDSATVSAPFMFPGNKFPSPSPDTLTFTGGPLETTKSFTALGLGIHERTFGDRNPQDPSIGFGRKFFLRESFLSTPEPSTLMLMVLGGSAALTYAWRIRRSAAD